MTIQFKTQFIRKIRFIQNFVIQTCCTLIQCQASVASGVVWKALLQDAGIALICETNFNVFKVRMRAMHFTARVYLSIDFSTTKGRAHGTFRAEKYSSHPECHEDGV